MLRIPPFVASFLLALSFGFGFELATIDAHAQDGREGGAETPRQARDTEPVQVASGLLLIDGQPMPAPYTVWTSEGVTYVNDRPIPDLSTTRSRGRGGAGQSGEGRRGEAFADDRGLGDSREFVARRSRRSISTEQVLLEGLMAKNLLIIQDDSCLQFEWNLAPALIDIAIGEDTRETKAFRLSSMTDRPHRVDPRFWFDFVDAFEPDTSFLAAVEQYQIDINALRVKYKSKIGSGVLSPTFTSLLAVAGSLIGIAVLIRTGIPTFKPLSSGKLMHWRHVDESGLRGRLVIPILGVLVALNSLDLVFTVNAGQTSRFVELSPIAADMMASPWILVAFKCLCVVTAIGILYLLRQTRLAQLSAWWVCLGYTLVIIRWATVNTALMA